MARSHRSLRFEQFEAKRLLAGNQAPLVDAGSDLELPVSNVAILEGIVSDDGPLDTVDLAWVKVRGPGDVTFAEPGAAQTTAQFSEPGRYDVRLEANDGQMTTIDYLTINVLAASQAPIVDAGADQTAMLATDVLLRGTVTGVGSPDNLITTWVSVSGPSLVTFADPGAEDTSARFSMPGIYVLQLEADNGDLRGIDQVTITVEAPNAAPRVDAGEDQTVLVTDGVTLDGTVTDDGLPESPGLVTTTWSQLSGPGTVTFGDASAVDTTASFSEVGTYVLQLQAHDGEFNNVDQLTVTVAGSSGLVGHWAFDEGSGPIAADASGAAHSGVLNGATWTNAGKVGNAIQFDGNNDFADTGNWDINSGKLTIAAWINADSFVGSYRDGRIVSKAVGAQTQDHNWMLSTIAQGSDTRLRFRLKTDGNTDTLIAGSGDLLPGQWYHVAAVYDGAMMRLFVDGTEVGSMPKSGPISDSATAPVWIGNNPVSQSQPFDGRIDDVRIYDTALTVLEILTLAQVTVSNQAPVVDAGDNRSVAVSAALPLDGTVSDDSLPELPGLVTTTWSQLSGPGTVSFIDASAVDTTASFSKIGTYVLSLQANDGEFTTSDELTVTVDPKQDYVYVSDLPFAATINGWGPVERDASNGEQAAGDGNPITINGVIYTKGLGVHADSEVTLELGGYFSRFLSDIGVDDEMSANGSVTFEVWGDGTKIFDSGLMTVDSPVQAIDISVAGVDHLKLVVTDGGNGKTADHADWADARVELAGGERNLARQVNAGADQSVVLSGQIALNGTVVDDHRPGAADTLTTTWSQVSGPGDVTFGNTATVDTTASFSKIGSYVLQLEANDGEFTNRDFVTVTVIGVEQESGVEQETGVEQEISGFFISPTGSSNGDGSANSPWDLRTALSHPSAVDPGDTIWLRGGTYRGGFVSTLTGTADNPITVRAYPGEHVVIDIYDSNPRTRFDIRGDYSHFIGLEFTSTDPKPRITSLPHIPEDIDRGALNIYGSHVKLINSVMHDLLGGLGFWASAEGGEVSGNIIYNNGALGPGAKLLHGIYTNNTQDTKRIADNFIFNDSGYGLHVYDNKDNSGYYIEGNTIFNNGGPEIFVGVTGSVQNVTLLENYTFNPGANDEVQLGYPWGTDNKNLALSDNYFASGISLPKNWSPFTADGNTVVGAITGNHPSDGFTVDRTPHGIEVFVRPNEYEAGRANVTVYNWDRNPSVEVDLSGVLAVGSSYQIHHVYELFGQPLVSGVYDGSTVTVPMNTTDAPRLFGGEQAFGPQIAGPEFGAFVVTTMPISPQPLLAAIENVGSNRVGDALTPVVLRKVLKYAAAELQASRLTNSQLEVLEQVQVQIADLDGARLGEATNTTITLDVSAAGHGWFIDTTPEDNSEFSKNSDHELLALNDSPAADRMDLLTVVMHELGHLIGYEHADDSSDLMAETLELGTRRELDIETLDRLLGSEY